MSVDVRTPRYTVRLVPILVEAVGVSEYTAVVGEFSHETNTFAPGRTGRESFAERREYLTDVIVAVRSNNHNRADYEPMASDVITVDSPGVAAFDPARYDYRRIRRPVFPLDDVPADVYPV